MYVRIPGWARNEPVPSDLYAFLNPSGEKVALKINSETISLYIKSDFTKHIENGFAGIERRWEKGDTIELILPMPVRRITAHENVKENLGKIALQRGPLVYCFEGVDNNGHVLNLSIPDDMKFEVEFCPDLLGGINILKSKGTEGAQLVAIPYYAWSHRGVGEMAVWLPRNKAR